jgi:hypothetical protein
MTLVIITPFDSPTYCIQCTIHSDCYYTVHNIWYLLDSFATEIAEQIILILYIMVCHPISVLILNIVHNIFSFHDTKVVICITFVLLKRANGLSYCLTRIASHTGIMVNIINQQQNQFRVKSLAVRTDKR